MLEELIKQRKDAYQAFNENEVATAEKIASFIKLNCNPSSLDCDVLLNHNYARGFDREEGPSFEFRGRIEFFTDDERRKEKGYRYDFGSNFDITINNRDGIHINKGTIGSYGLLDKFQIARDKMLAKIWENHDAIVDIMKTNFNPELYNKFNNIDREIERIEYDIKRRKEQEAYNVALTQLKNAKYFYEESKREKYDDEDWNHTKLLGHTYHVYNIFKIDKITDKQVHGVYTQWHWENKRLDIGRIIYRIQKGSLKLSTELPEDTFIPLEEGTPSQEASV